MSSVMAHLMIELVDNLAFSGIPVARLGIAAIASLADKKSSGGGPSNVGEFVNHLVMTGQFDDAEKVVHMLDLPYSTEQDILRQIGEIRRNMARACEWNQKLMGLLQQGKVEEAISFAESLDMPREKKTEVINNIRQAARQREERIRQAEEWSRELTRLISNGKIRKAKKYVKSLPIDQSAKEGILSKL